MQQWLKEVARGKKGAKDLRYEDSLKIAQSILSNEATDAQIAAYLVAERIKTESPEELLAFIHTLRQKSDSLRLNRKITDQLIDFAGPYNGRNSFAATIPVSLLLAEYNIPVSLAASDSLPPKYGTSIKAIMEQLGWVNMDKVEMMIYEENFTFLDAEKYCQPLARIRKIREEIGIRTLFNTVEKLVNLSGAKNIMLGAFHRTAIHKLNEVFKQLEYENVYIVQGMEGSEDVPVHRNSFVFHWKRENLDSFTIKPADFGLENKNFDKKEKLNAKQQARIIRSILSGEKDENFTYYYNQVLLNAGLRYYLFHITPTIHDGIQIAKEQLNSGRVIEIIDRWEKKS
ncbi:anthranilate phosphoribosyltransferase [Gracilibacillus dipsosauri]|uniref:Glycosyl transferase n=1 Tax=Gracilibacillus dipsosauri TaxID=178340 RepID=A0A317L2D2_9BACI|nr:glycosyl transferase [Gracilibacillus dipsosauri]PWU69058.1 glycosyl transferase [Gracilibacillus dipsosauri]